MTPTRDLSTVVLRHGQHDSPEDGMCAVEAAAWVAGEEHTDQPQCVCPVIAAFCRRWNDDLHDDEERTRLLLPLVPKIVDTRSTPAVEQRRSWMALDWMLREQTPAWLALAGLASHAGALREAAEVTSMATMAAMSPALDAARVAAKSAARVAAWDAARDAAWGAAWDATWACAKSAARVAAWAGALDAIAPTATALQESAARLVVRMCEVGP